MGAIKTAALSRRGSPKRFFRLSSPLSHLILQSLPQPPHPPQIPEPQVTYSLHAVWTPDLTATPPQSQCATSGTVAIPHFHFYSGWKDGAPAFFSVDWILIEELTNEHEPQFWYLSNPQGSSGFPYGCTMPPVSDPENWNWTTWDLAGAMIGLAMRNSSYRITVHVEVRILHERTEEVYQ